MKENEEILKNEIQELKRQLHFITMYLDEQKRLIEGNSPDVSAYSHAFWSQQQVSLGYVSQEQSINVYVEVAPGSYKQVHPIISDCGGQKQLDFDMQYTGYAVIGYANVASSMTLPQTPMITQPNEIILLDEPKPEEPIIRTGIYDTWQR